MNFDKRTLRRELIQSRSEIPKELKKYKDTKITERVLSLPAFQNATLVLCYVSTSEEIDTSDIINYCFLNKKSIAVPRCVGEDLHFHLIQSWEDLSPGYFNILEPNPSLYKPMDFHNSVCIVPALAINEQNQRLGYGKGFYDRFLSSFSGISIGLCYNEFRRPIPVDHFDIPVHIVLSE